MLLADPDALARDDWILTKTRDDAEGRCGKEAVQQTLERATRERLGIRRYVQAIAAVEAEDLARRATRKAARAERPVDRSRRGSPRKAPYERIKRAIVDRELPSISLMDFRYWGRDASDDDFRQAAVDLLKTEDETHLTKYLQIFGFRPFPLAIDPLLTLVHHPDDWVMWAAAQALAQVANPRVQSLGLKILADPGRHGSRRSAGVQLLVSSFQSGDEAVLIDLLKTPRHADEHHRIGTGVLDVLRAHPSADAVPVLLALYEFGPCTFCRKDAVESLRQREALPGWLLEECRYDASAYLREAADADL